MVLVSQFAFLLNATYVRHEMILEHQFKLLQLLDVSFVPVWNRMSLGKHELKLSRRESHGANIMETMHRVQR